MEETRFLYSVFPKKPIKGILEDGRAISSRKSLNLTKEEVQKCMNCGSVYRWFANDNRLERVTTLNIDRLHNAEYLTEEQFKDAKFDSVAGSTGSVTEVAKEEPAKVEEAAPVVEEEPKVEEAPALVVEEKVEEVVAEEPAPVEEEKVEEAAPAEEAVVEETAEAPAEEAPATEEVADDEVVEEETSEESKGNNNNNGNYKKKKHH